MAKFNETKSVLKVVITGPESTGKTSLCEALADHFKTGYVPEYSRVFIENNDGKYTQEDLIRIAEGQMKSEDAYQRKYNSVLICDTSLEVIMVWSEWKYHHCDASIIKNANKRTPDLFLLLTPDLAWQPDPQRENPDDREELFSYYQQSLQKYNTKVVIISGAGEERITKAIQAIGNLNKDNQHPNNIL